MRGRQVARWTFRGLLIVIALALAALLAALLALRTDYGREQIRTQLEEAIGEKLRGEVSIGRIEGSVLGDLVLRDVVLRDSAGDVVVEIDRARLEYDAFDLIDQRLDARQVAVEGVTVIDRGTLNTLVIPGDKPSAWVVDIDRVRVSGGRYVRIRPGGEELEVDRIEVAGQVSYAADDLEATLTRARARFRDLVAALDGKVVYENGLLTAAETTITAGESRLEIAAGRFESESGALELRFDGHVAAAEIRRLAPRWRAAIELGGTVRRGGDDEPFAVDLSGAIGASPLSTSLSVGVDPLSAGGTIEITGASPRSWLAGAPAGDLDLAAELSLAGPAPDELTGTVELEASGAIAGARIRDLAGTVDLDRESLSAELKARALAYRDARIVNATIEATAAPLGDRATVEADIRGDRVSYRDAEIVAAIVKARASRLTAEPIIDATVRGDRVRYRDAVAARLSVDGRLDTGAMTGGATVRASGLRYGGERVGPLSARVRLEGPERIEVSLRAGVRRGLGVSLRGAARLGERATSVRLSELEIRSRKLRWRGDARFAVTDRGAISIDRFELSSEAGSIEASGRISGGGRRGSMQLAARDLDLAALSRSIPGVEAPPLSGHTTAEVDLRLSPLRIDSRIKFREVAWGEATPPLSGELEIAGDARRARGTLEVRSPRAGSARVVADVDLPDAPLSAAAWSRFDRRQLRDVELAFKRVDLARVVAYARGSAPVEGLLSGSIDLVDGGEQFVVDLRIAGIRGSRLREPIDLELKGSGGPDEIESALVASIKSRQAVRGEVVLGAGLGALWDGELDKLRRAPLEANLVIPGLPLAVVGRHLDIDRELSGQLSGSVYARGSIDEPRADLNLRARDAGVGDLRGVQLHAVGELDPQRWSGRAAITHRGGMLRATGKGGTDRRAPLEGQLVARRFDLSVISPVLARQDLIVTRVEGDLFVDVAVAGTMAQPRISGTARVARGEASLREGLRRLEELTLKVQLTESRIAVSGRAESGGGDIELDAKIAHAGLRPRSLVAEIVADELPFETAALRGKLDDARLELEGAERDGLWRIDAELRDVIVQTPERRDARELHPMDPPEDILFVDPAAIAARRAEKQADPLFDPLVVQLTTPGGFRVLSGDGSSINGNADLEITRRGGEVAIAGIIAANEGRITLFDRRYRVNRAVVTFDGERPINPRVDLFLEHELDSVYLYIDIGGSLEEPEVELSSVPSIYSRAELLGFVLGGRPDGDGGDGGGGLGSGATSLASSFIAGQIGSLVAGPLPFDTVRIGAGEEPGGVSSVTVGRWVDEDVFIAYHRRLEAEDDENQNEAVVEYRFLPRWVLEGTIGDKGNGSVDILWVRRFE